MEHIVSQTAGMKLMSSPAIVEILEAKFEERRVAKIIKYFSGSTQELQRGHWENSLFKSGKFIEATIKLIWTFAGKTLPREKDFKVGNYAQKIINEKSFTEIKNDGIRLQIPRASIFLYDITSNRGGRHDSDDFDPSEMDAITVSSTCSWVLAELVRFCASEELSPDEAKKIVGSVIERRYPDFEEIEKRIYVNHRRHKSAIQCALMILYRKYPERMNKSELLETVLRHGYKKSALKFERLSPFGDVDQKGNILLRDTGRRKVEKLLEE